MDVYGVFMNFQITLVVITPLESGVLPLGIIVYFWVNNESSYVTTSVNNGHFVKEKD